MPISSPNSSGNSGAHFEQHVGTLFLSLLLVNGIPPILKNCTVTKVHLQTEHLGWNTDDVLVCGTDALGETRKLACQVKQTFTVSSSNSECVKTIVDAWKDYSNQSLFDRKHDRFAIITLRGTDVYLKYFVGLLDCARASCDADDFKHRLSVEGMVHNKVKKYYTEIETIVSKFEKQKIEHDKLWPFLSALNGLSFDLETGTSQTEAIVKTMLAMSANGPDQANEARLSWNELFVEAAVGKSNAKSYDRESLPQSVRTRHSQISSQQLQTLSHLKGHSEVVLKGIKTTIGGGLHLDRVNVVQQVVDATERNQVVMIAGDAGSGKSVVAKSAFQSLNSDCFAFCFRIKEFAVAHLDETLAKCQASIGAKGLEGLLAGQGKKLLLIESAERLLEASTRDAFGDLLDMTIADQSWRILITCRSYASELVQSALLQPNNIGCKIITVPPLDDDEIKRKRPKNC